MSLPNVISLLRIALVPVLLAVAYLGHARLFAALLAASFASDVLDGFLARRLGQSSELGARLDSAGDFAVYISIPICAWWLMPEVFARNLAFFAAATASVLAPPIVALVKFRRLSSYHTVLVKLAALLLGGSLIVLFAGGPEWLFRAAVPFAVLAGAEEIAITCVLEAPVANVTSLWHVARERGKRGA